MKKMTRQDAISLLNRTLEDVAFYRFETKVLLNRDHANSHEILILLLSKLKEVEEKLDRVLDEAGVNEASNKAIEELMKRGIQP